MLDHDGHCMLDEFANIGKIPNFVRLIATIRSRRISCGIILQTVSQGKSLYKDDWETIAGNCDSQLFLGGNEPSATEYISDRLGDQTIDVIETSETKGLNGSWTRSTGKNARKLLLPITMFGRPRWSGPGRRFRYDFPALSSMIRGGVVAGNGDAR